MSIDPMPRKTLELPPPVGFVTLKAYEALAAERAALEKRLKEVETAQAAAGVLLTTLPLEHQCWANMQDSIDNGSDVGEIMRAALRALAEPSNG